MSLSYINLYFNNDYTLEQNSSYTFTNPKP